MTASTAYYPGPDEVRLTYTSGGYPHQARYNCQVTDNPGPPFLFGDVHLLQANAGSQLLSDWVDAWVALLQPLYNSGTSTFDFADLWSYEADSYNAAFQSTYDISLTGSSGTAVNAARQSIFMFRTTAGHRMSIQLMSSIRDQGGILSYSGMTAAEQAIVDAILDPTCCWAGRDNHFPASFVHLLPGQNEALYKKVYR